MPRCRESCITTVSGSSTPEEIWSTFRTVHGATYETYSENYGTYLGRYPTVTSGTVVADTPAGIPSYDTWLNWRYTAGSEVYGNLPQWKRDQHVGHCWTPCPFSTQSSYLRTRQLLRDDVYEADSSKDLLAVWPVGNPNAGQFKIPDETTGPAIGVSDVISEVLFNYEVEGIRDHTRLDGRVEYMKTKHETYVCEYGWGTTISGYGCPYYEYSYYTTRYHHV